MPSRWSLLFVALLVVPGPPVVSGPLLADAVGASDSASILAVYPNPVTDRDAGEFVVLGFAEPTNVSGWTLTDGTTTARLPNATVSGRVAFSTEPGVVRNLTDRRVLGLSGRLLLANDGETLELHADGEVVDATTFGRAPSGELWRPTNGTWTPPGRTDRAVERIESVPVRAFVLPDAPGVPLDALRVAEERVLLAGYTFTSRRVARHLRRAARRGVTVRVLVEDAPVGGISRRQATVLDSLVAAGVDVQVLGGPRARYRYHHAKYAVVDDRALVLTENWKPSGVGGRSSRGWGVLVDEPRVADELAAVFAADAGWRDTVPWESFRDGRGFEPPDPANGTYSSHHLPRNLTADSVSVIVAPDNAEGATVDLLRSAEESVRIEQVAIGSRRQPFLQTTLDAARRGVEVRVLLSGAWYVREDNRQLVEWLNRRADAEGLSLSARLVDPRSRFEKLHAKGVIVDGERVIVGSMNWNNNSARENREVMVLLEGDAVGGYYARVFDADWKRGKERFPVGLAVAVVVGLLAARLMAAKKVRFE